MISQMRAGALRAMGDISERTSDPKSPKHPISGIPTVMLNISASRSEKQLYRATYDTDPNSSAFGWKTARAPASGLRMGTSARLRRVGPIGGCFCSVSWPALLQDPSRMSAMTTEHICALWIQVGSLVGAQSEPYSLTWLRSRSPRALCLSGWRNPKRNAMLVDPCS